MAGLFGFDIDVGDVVGAVGQLGKAALDFQFAKKAQRQAKRATSRPQQQGWGGMRPRNAMVGRGQVYGLGLDGAPVPYPSGPMPGGGVGDVLGGILGEVLRGGARMGGGPDVGNVYYNEGAVGGDFDNVTGGGSTTAGPRVPSVIRTTGPRGECLEFRRVSRRPIVSSEDLSTIKRVACAMQSIKAAFEGRKAPKRRKCGKRRTRKKSRRACRTLTAKQLAAGFGGAQYRR